MKTSCGCKHHQQTNSKPLPKSVEQRKVQHILNLLVQNFVSPYKIMYLLDPQQADHFKQRNQSQGCCTSRHITISPADRTQTEQALAQLISLFSIRQHLDRILSLASQQHASILAKGKQDKLQINDKVEKFILDKVLGECTNQYFYQQLAQKVRQNNTQLNQGMALWATPNTWHARYPEISLDFIPGTSMKSLLSQGWAYLKGFLHNTEQLQKQLQLLEKDGKFESNNWISVKTSTAKLKLMSNPEKYVEMVDSHDKHLFPSLCQSCLTMSSIPFELNMKANIFCTVSPNLHVCYVKGKLQTQPQKGHLQFTVIAAVSETTIYIQQDHRIGLKAGDAIIIDNSKTPSKIVFKQEESFLLRNFIQVVQKKQ